MPADYAVRPWRGRVYRHIPGSSPCGPLETRFAARSQENRWNRAGEPTLYFAGDRAVLIGEFARHFERDPTGTGHFGSNPPCFRDRNHPLQCFRSDRSSRSGRARDHQCAIVLSGSLHCPRDRRLPAGRHWRRSDPDSIDSLSRPTGAPQPRALSRPPRSPTQRRYPVDHPSGSFQLVPSLPQPAPD